MGEVSTIPLQQSIADLGVAYNNFFKSLKGERKGQKVRPPKFKKKDNHQTARFRRGGFSIKKGKVYLAKIGKLKTVGLKTFAVLSTREQVSSPDYSKVERKARKAQRKLSRRKKGSKRREVMRLKVAKLKARQADTRKGFLHKLSTRVVRENQVIVLENLNVSGMLRNRCLSRAISQCGWREFRMMCDAKSSKFGREFVVINRWEPTSQTCSDCGYRWGKLDLSVREVVCMNCSAHHDRDGNAARNIEQAGKMRRGSASAIIFQEVGVGHTHDSKRTGRTCKTPVGAVSVELSPI